MAAPRDYEVHWIDKDTDAPKYLAIQGKQAAFAVASVLEKEGHHEVRVLLQIDPPR